MASLGPIIDHRTGGTWDQIDSDGRLTEAFLTIKTYVIGTFIVSGWSSRMGASTSGQALRTKLNKAIGVTEADLIVSDYLEKMKLKGRTVLLDTSEPVEETLRID